MTEPHPTLAAYMARYPDLTLTELGQRVAETQKGRALGLTPSSMRVALTRLLSGNRPRLRLETCEAIEEATKGEIPADALLFRRPLPGGSRKGVTRLTCANHAKTPRKGTSHS